ncbi:MAG TPA: glycosyltransferase, partial [Chitinophagaceae bacterium]|nr:glycosyltransferase [Chitinophagaceae bacterium]
EPTIITVDGPFIENFSIDDLLLQTFPQDIRIIKVPAIKATLTRKLGIGSLSLRAYFPIKKQVNKLLKAERFDLVYFSTTAFHVMALGPGWKKKFGVPFILDIQDPWYNTYYFQNALHKKTIKAWLFHQLDKYLEAKTIPATDGIISVSSGYRDLYVRRYPNLTSGDFRIIPFGCAVLDFPIAKKSVHASRVKLSAEGINMVYIGRGGQDMELAIDIILDGVKIGLKKENKYFKKVHIWFIGTSYAQNGKGIKTIETIAEKKGLTDRVTEITDRLPYFETLYLLSKADILFVPGSTDPSYTASKIYPYIYTNKPMLAVFHNKSSVCDVVEQTSSAKVVAFGDVVGAEARQNLASECYAYLSEVLRNNIQHSNFDCDSFEPYTAQCMTKKQTDFFEQVIQKNSNHQKP